MKKLILLLAVLISAAGLTAQTSTEWKWVHPTPQGQYLRWVQAIDSNTWVAGGDYGQFIKTTNRGLNWVTTTGGYMSSLYPNAGIYQNLICANFFNANTGYIGVQASRGIIKTTNGGLTFDTIQVIPSGSGTANAIQFQNMQTGFIAGNSVFKLQRTTNGGLNWYQFPNLGTSTLYAMHAFDTARVMVAGSTSGKIFRTTNSGVNWDTIVLGGTSTIYNIKFFNANEGVVVGSSGFFRYTSNGGANWFGTNPTTVSLYSVVREGNDFYASGYTSSSQDLFKTTDYGATWTSVSFAGASTITGFLTYSMDKSGSNFMLVGNYGEIIRSTNGGANWNSLVYRRSMANMVDITGFSNGRVLALGYGIGSPDNIMYSANGGNTWNTFNYTVYNNFSDLQMLNANTGYISGRYGIFLKTTNGGETWDTSKSNNPVLVPYFNNGVHFINENTGWIVGGTAGIGGNTKIWKTTNGGTNWAEQVSAYSGPVGVKIEMYNASTGYMTHSIGLQKTTNGGDNWSLTTAPATGSVTYSPLKVLDSVTVVTGGNNSHVYRTVNGGTSWDSLNFPVKAGTIFCTDWYDKNNGVAGAVIGVVGKTTNAGQTWQMYNVGGYTVYGLDMVHPDTIYAVCGNTAGAQIFKYTKGTVTSGFTFENKVPVEYNLRQNYPNPFNPVTTIEFDLVKAGNVSIKVFDIAGREYTTEISNLNLMPGNYKLNFNGAKLSSGVYFYSLNVNGQNIATKKMMLLK